MITRATPIAFDHAMTNGRTRPAMLTCETALGEEVEVVAKFSAGCDQGVINLAREVIAACLAADLGLPIPVPYLLDITPAWAATVAEADRRAIIQRGSPIAFGSTLAKGGFGAWNDGIKLSPGMALTALAIFVFDAIIQNPDRRSENPNCLVRGTEFRIFDHELAFAHGMILGWLPPWRQGGLRVLEQPGFHIFRQKLRAEPLDFTHIQESWKSLSDARIAEYVGSIPAEWSDAAAAVASAIQLIKDARDNFEACLVEIQRVLA